MGFDAGYHSAAIAHLLEKNHVIGVIGYRRHAHATDTFGKYRFIYDFEHDCYICPAKHHLYWKTTNREGFREYYSSAKECAECPMRAVCMSASSKRRLVTRHVWQDALDDITAFTKTPIGKRIYQWRKETIERSFAEAKQNHGLRFARMLGIQNMREQCFLTAAIQNMKRLAKAFFYFFPCYHSYISNGMPFAFAKNMPFVDALRRTVHMHVPSVCLYRIEIRSG